MFQVFNLFLHRHLNIVKISVYLPKVHTDFHVFSCFFTSLYQSHVHHLCENAAATVSELIFQTLIITYSLRGKKTRAMLCVRVCVSALSVFVSLEFSFCWSVYKAIVSLKLHVADTHLNFIFRSKCYTVGVSTGKKKDVRFRKQRTDRCR